MSTIDGAHRLVVFRRLDAYPNFILSFSQSMDYALVAWWHAVWIVAAGWAVAAAMVGALAIWVAREWAARQAIEDRYRILFDSNPSPMLVAERHTQRFLAVNDAAVEQYGWSRDELLAMRSDDLEAGGGRVGHAGLGTADRIRVLGRQRLICAIARRTARS